MERQTGTYKEAQFTRIEIHELKPLWEPISGRKTRIVIDKLLEAHNGQVGELKTPGRLSNRGPPYFCKFHLQKFEQVLRVNIREKKNPLMLPAGVGEKELFCNIPEHSFLNKA